MPNSNDVAIHTLPAVLDYQGVRELAEFLARHDGGPLRLDATQTRKVGTLAMQVLAVGARAQERDGGTMSVVDPTGLLERCFDGLGLTSQLPTALIMEASD